VDTILHNTQGAVATGTSGLVTRLNAFSTLMTQLNVTTPSGTSLNCTYCATVGQQVADIATEIDDKVHQQSNSLRYLQAVRNYYQQILN